MSATQKKVEKVVIRCASCGEKDWVSLYTWQQPPAPAAHWMRMPAGWWLLATAEPNPRALHGRCPACVVWDNTHGRTRRAATAEDIQRATATHFGLTVKQLLGADRYRSIAYARNLAMYLCRAWTQASYPELGRAFGGRDHTTIMHGVAAMKVQAEAEPETRAHIDAITAELARSTRTADPRA